MRIALVDISAIFWSAWHATGDGPKAYDATIERMRNISTDYDRTIVCCDRGHSGRDKIYVEYKATREAKPAAAIEQLRSAIAFLATYGCHIAKVEGFEADDVIASLAKQAEARADIEAVHILSNDKDLAQLVTDKVTMRKLSDNKHLGPDEIRQVYGVPPHQVVELLALMGDKSDNVPGCPGIGAKRAAELIHQFGDAAGAITAAMQKMVPGKIGESLVEHRDAITMSRALVVLQYPEIDLEPFMQEPEQPVIEAPEDTIEEPEDAPMPSPQPPARQTHEAQYVERPVAVVHVPWERQLEPVSLKQAWHIAESSHASKAFNFPTKESAYMAILAGRERGIGAVASLRVFFVLDGKLGMFTQGMVAEILRSGLAEYFRPLLQQCNESKSVWVTKRKGEDVEHVFEFTIEMARKRGLNTRKNWTLQPDTMLRHRCAAELARAIYPDVVAGVYTEADIGDHMAQEFA